MASSETTNAHVSGIVHPLNLNGPLISSSEEPTEVTEGSQPPSAVSSAQRNDDDRDNDPVIPPTSANSPPQSHRWRDFKDRIYIFFGLRGPERYRRRALIRFTFDLALGLAQFVGILTILVLSSVRDSPNTPGSSQWTACSKPLAAWDIFWLIRTVFNCAFILWTWYRLRIIHLRIEIAQRRPDPPEQAAELPRTDTTASNQRGEHPEAGPTGRARTPRPVVSYVLRYTTGYNLLRYFLAAFTTLWFCTIWLLQFVGFDQCKDSSPILWWGTTALVVVVVVVILHESGLLAYLFMKLTTRNSRPSGPVKVPKLSYTEVNDIPLVLYIPAAPKPTSTPQDGVDPNSVSELDSKSLHTYPPTSSLPALPDAAAVSSKPGWFSSLFKKSKNAGGASSSDVERATKDGPDPWEAMWEKGQYPFIQIESHLSACAICLEDYEEPRRVRNAQPENTEDPATRSEGHSHGRNTSRSLTTTAAPELLPLRLLNCGHVFHRVCVDLWLMERAGRCPSCQCPARHQKKPKK